MCTQCVLAPSPLQSMTDKEIEALTDEEIDEICDMMLSRPTYHEHWRERGAYYGYPSCCVNAFVRRPMNAGFTEDEEKYSKAGFLPCKKHLKMIKQGKIQIEDLIQNRECNTPFPIDDLDMEHYEDNQTEN